MTISINYTTKLVISDADIPDIIAFKNSIRDIEDSAEGMLHAPVITFKQIATGGGSFFYGVDLINGYRLLFPYAGSYLVIGNIGAEYVPVAGVFIEATKALAFATVAGSTGGSGASASELSAALRPALTTINNNVKKSSLLIPARDDLT